ncbi:hemerythrin domain-containing protein [Vulcanisaeta souniana]|uniref:Hemerythrin-like domain-containing protein n=1 Tax=Vulcanisaeta souniana JCM 11219 TaxID=1293586 RepID=A0A830EKI4_9CREN|nr:hemerythrin domain-containing protein [Vulcanisaeta souniana]BDR92944.1 hypothetical protein Vsou_20370 [Vulcanisaeta souniana JCM 11219]GGI85798.1 hypothetical protein GCM10007112_23590 [Vulcanisaeta souniana JCM 11219]
MVIRVNTAYVIDNLIKDHDVILESLKVLYKIVNNDNSDARDLEFLIRFFDAFIDKCHHAKEEYILFPSLNLRLFPFEGSPVYVMVTEHGIARYLIRISEELLRMWIDNKDEGARQALIDHLKLLADHLTQHIKKENDVLFPGSLALDTLESSRTIEDIENETGHEKWVMEINELKKKYGIT